MPRPAIEHDNLDSVAADPELVKPARRPDRGPETRKARADNQNALNWSLVTNYVDTMCAGPGSRKCSRALTSETVRPTVIPAKAGILSSEARAPERWVPAFAGTPLLLSLTV